NFYMPIPDLAIVLTASFIGIVIGFFFSSRRRHTMFSRDWSSDVCSSDLVEALQELIRLAGHGAALGPAGVDGVYGNGTAEGLRLCRADVGSRALPGYGDKVTGHAFAQ